MRVVATTLPPYQQIDHSEIRTAAKKYADAQAKLNAGRKALSEMADKRDDAAWQDAREAEQAFAGGKTPPKRRRHVAEHDERVEALEHETRVAKLSLDRALNDFQAVVDEHAAEWIQSCEERVVQLDEQWEQVISTLAEVHRVRTAAYVSRSKLVGGEVPGVAVKLKPSQLHDVDLAWNPDPYWRHNQRANVLVEDLVVALRDVGRPFVPETPLDTFPAAAFLASVEHARAVKRGREEGQATLPGEIREMPNSGDERYATLMAAATKPAPASVRREKVERRRAELTADNGRD